jgi:23S rRNA pseudouridine2605 synthase
MNYLFKFIAKTTGLSRRKSIDAIKSGRIFVNSVLVIDPSSKMKIRDIVTFDGKKLLDDNNLIYIVLNKPKGCITSKSDDKKRPIVMDLIPKEITRLVDPVGRLDYNTSGALILTNDGQLANKLSHPKYNAKKIYHVTSSKLLDKKLVDKIKAGVKIEDAFVKLDKVSWHKRTPKTITVEIHSGKNRVIRKIFEAFGIFVKKLHRYSFAGITTNKLAEGAYRNLSKKEINSIQ